MSGPGGFVLTQIIKNSSRSTLGYTYRGRYQEVECPECLSTNTYVDDWGSTLSLTCLVKDCRHKWYQKKYVETQADIKRRDQIAMEMGEYRWE